MRDDMIPMTMVDKLKEAITQVANDMRATNSPFDEITVNAFEDKIDEALNSIIESGYTNLFKLSEEEPLDTKTCKITLNVREDYPFEEVMEQFKSRLILDGCEVDEIEIETEDVHPDLLIPFKQFNMTKEEFLGLEKDEIRELISNFLIEHYDSNIAIFGWEIRINGIKITQIRVIPSTEDWLY